MSVAVSLVEEINANFESQEDTSVVMTFFTDPQLAVFYAKTFSYVNDIFEEIDLRVHHQNPYDHDQLTSMLHMIRTMPHIMKDIEFNQVTLSISEFFEFFEKFKVTPEETYEDPDEMNFEHKQIMRCFSRYRNRDIDIELVARKEPIEDVCLIHINENDDHSEYVEVEPPPVFTDIDGISHTYFLTERNIQNVLYRSDALPKSTKEVWYFTSDTATDDCEDWYMFSCIKPYDHEKWTRIDLSECEILTKRPKKKRQPSLKMKMNLKAS